MKKSIGLPVKKPEKECSDKHCPFHGKISIRGKLFDGKATGAKARKTITLKRETPAYYKKFKRYARSESAIHAHVPDCLEVKEGNTVLTAECRPISKSVSFVVVEVRK